MKKCKYRGLTLHLKKCKYRGLTLHLDRFETSQEKARRIIAEELRLLGWKPEDLRSRRKGDPEKVRMARRLRAETTMTLAWVAQQLEMGRWGYVSHLLKGK